ncbi:predicted protein, partial [Nematostella vectensis]
VVGKNFTFTCRVEGIPKPDIKWKYNGGPLNLAHSTINNTLVVFNVQNTDRYEGSYECEASSRAGNASSSASLTVYALPKITKLLNKTLVAERGSNVQLSCQASGDPTPKYKWTYKGVPISPRENVQLEDDNRLLILKKVSPVSNGVYRCIAYNAEGNDTTETKLIVHVSVGIVVPLPEKVIFMEGQPLNLTCAAEGIPLPNVTWYHYDKIITQTDGSRYSITNNVSGVRLESTLRLNNTRFGDRGNYSCVFKN